MQQFQQVQIADTIQDDFTLSIPQKDEIWNILKDMRSDASPGPDGLNVAFYKAAWHWIGDDLTKMVQAFYARGTLPDKLNQTCITLIPKKIAAINV